MNTQKHVFYGAEGRYVAEVDFDRLTAERDSFRAVLEGAGYRHIDDIAKNSIEDSMKLGSMVADITMRLQKERDALQQLLNARDEEVGKQENSRANLLKALEMVAGLYSYESSSGGNSMKLYDARSIALLAIAEAKGEQQ